MRVKSHNIDEHRVSAHQVLVGGNPTHTRRDLAQCPPVIVLPEIPKCSCRERRLFIAIFDQSGSVTGYNDPARALGGRFSEFALVLDRLGTCRCKSELVHIGYFAPEHQHGVGPLPLTRRGRRDLLAALAQPPQSTGSTLSPSLSEVEDLVVEHPDYHPVTIVFTDCQLFDNDLDHVYHRFRALPGDRHVVVLNAPIPNQLHNDPAALTTHIAWDSKAGDVADAVLSSIAMHRT